MKNEYTRSLKAGAVCLLFLASLSLGASESLDVGDVIVSQVADSPIVHFTILTSGGFVGFSVPKDWKVMAMQSKPPVTVAAFQVSNVADDGTSDSTNVAINLVQPDTDKGKAALSRVGKSYEGAVQPSSRSGWDCFSQEAHQHGTLYSILDAKKQVADVVVTVRVAWPHLKKNVPDYDANVGKAFNSILDSVDGSFGKYVGKPNDVVRRPEP